MMLRTAGLALIAATLSFPALAQDVPLPAPRPANAAIVEPAAPAAVGEPVQLAAAPRIVQQPSGQGTPPGQLSAEQRAAVAEVNRYFNSVQILSGNFIQDAAGGQRSEGRFFLKKPGKLRFEFEPPSRLQIIADGKSVAVRDRKLATQDIYPLSQTPLRYLLQSNIDLMRDTKVTAVYTEPEMVSIAIEETNKVAGTSRLLLVFAGPQYELRQWTVTDPQGLDTTVAIYNLDTASTPSDRLFAIDYSLDPAQRR